MTLLDAIPEAERPPAGLRALRLLRSRWRDVYGDSFPAGHRLWGCGAWVLLRAAMNDEKARSAMGHGWEPSGPWERFRLSEERVRRAEARFEQADLEVLNGDALPVDVQEVWDAHPEGPPKGERASALRHRVRLTTGAWVSGNVLRASLDLTGFDTLALSPTDPVPDPVKRGVLLIRRGALVGMAGPLDTPPREMHEEEGPPWPAWKRLA